ncbi:MAG: hemerythrin domain-containing protein [Betaproteobacteria bacterium]
MSGRHILEERSKLDVGIAEFDGQNRDIHSLLERLRSATANQYGYATSTILGELNTQMRITFAVQESLMRLLAFPDTEAHVFEHRQFLDQLEVFRKRSQDFDVVDGVLGFIRGWLVDHIQNCDRKFAAHFLRRGMNPVTSEDH